MLQHESMKHFQHNSTDPFEISDEQLDQLLAKVACPTIESNRNRRMHRELSSLLRRTRKPGISFDARLAMGALGAIAVCGLLLMISLLGRSPAKRPIVDSNVITVTAPIETKQPELMREIISHVVWYPRESQRPKRLTDWMKKQHARLQVSMSQFADSELGLMLLEDAVLAFESEQREARRNHDLSTLRTLQAVQQMRHRLEDELVQEIQSNRTTAPQKTVAFRKLCRCGSAQTLPFVLDHWENPRLQTEIASCAKRLANSSTIAQMAGSTPDLNLKTILMTRLLDRGDPHSVGLFLELTERQQLFSIAQNIGRKVRHLPKTQLLLALRSNRLGVVRAASITISNVDDPQITQHLFELAQHPETAQAAVLALTARQDVPSAQFVEFASNDLRWSATVVTAQKKWNRLLAIN